MILDQYHNKPNIVNFTIRNSIYSTPPPYFHPLGFKVNLISALFCPLIITFNIELFCWAQAITIYKKSIDGFVKDRRKLSWVQPDVTGLGVKWCSLDILSSCKFHGHQCWVLSLLLLSLLLLFSKLIFFYFFKYLIKQKKLSLCHKLGFLNPKFLKTKQTVDISNYEVWWIKQCKFEI